MTGGSGDRHLRVQWMPGAHADDVGLLSIEHLAEIPVELGNVVLLGKALYLDWSMSAQATKSMASTAAYPRAWELAMLPQPMMAAVYVLGASSAKAPPPRTRSRIPIHSW